MRNKKGIWSAALVLFMTLGMVLSVRADSGSPSKVKVGYNGKTVTFNSDSEPKSLKNLEKKWGKRTGTDGEAYIWEKGETTIMVEVRPSGKTLGYVGIDTKDANVSVAGIQVGMEKDTVVKRMRDIYGEKNVLAAKKGQDWDFYGEDGYTLIGTPKSDEDARIFVLRGHFNPIIFYLENDLISEIHWIRL